MILVNLALCASLTICHLISTMHSWNNALYLKFDFPCNLYQSDNPTSVHSFLWEKYQFVTEQAVNNAVIPQNLSESKYIEDAYVQNNNIATNLMIPELKNNWMGKVCQLDPSCKQCYANTLSKLFSLIFSALASNIELAGCLEFLPYSCCLCDNLGLGIR